MNTNFFNQIAQLQITGDLQLTIAKGAENNLIVSVMLQNEQCGDNAKNIIPPLNLRGTAEELDNGFFEKITTPIQTASGLMVDMESFMKQLEETKKQSAMEKEKADKQKKDQEAKDKKFKDAMAKADELEKEGKFREAWVKVPEITEFPEKADEIRKRKRELSDKFSAPSLFGAIEEEKPEPAKSEQVTADYPTETAQEN
ncbi:MAG: PRTRC system protein E [Flavobacterium lindanitolerans]|jgi:PRTRC genetic system protein E|uniref:PRTRC system protein E n=1 Tax=Flavobacterium microcysteis TaxID=2596891 RepID=A0A501Q1T2_9FLAO|nr:MULTISPECIES: PRTRC system protein E [Flavobacterium]MBL7869766.1 PRTRC system protein E [Flavobacterium lindanitolerans]MDL2143503.1 PRTRC system protein E [Flavobacterium tructae]TPD65946.1 PRTRC system protein E [Flavobacterium microcysteis]